MDFKAIAATVIRLFSIAWLFVVIQQLHSLFVIPVETGDNIVLAIPLIMLSIQFAMCVAGWFFPVTIASLLIPRTAMSSTGQQYELKAWLSIGLVVVGFLALSTAVPDMVYWLTLYNMPSHIYELTPPDQASMITTAVEILFALMLVFGSKGLSTLLSKLKRLD